MTPLAHLDTLHDWAALLAIAALTALTIWAAPRLRDRLRRRNPDTPTKPLDYEPPTHGF